MTDITELAKSLKAAANTTADAIDRLKAFPGDELIDLSQHQGEQVDIDITTLNEWYELSSPANVLALVEALEKAKGMEAYWKTQCRGITDHCEELQARIAELESRTVTATATAAAADVLAERKRQVTTEGWTPEHDDQHVNFEMAIAGGLYAISAVDSHHKLRNSAPSAWPWDRKWWKPDGPRRDLVKAGALILAEIERLDRAAGIKVEAE
ncbi:TPA: hypothetical protein L9W67_002677 [Klebsiella pneumoniae]|nr:hypothetical protein [Klebsiella pneumoniae]